MQDFIETTRQEPEKKNVNLRLRSYDEIYHFYDLAQMAPQAERCIQCGNPFCAVIGCPLGNYIPQWLAAIAAKDLETAFRLSNESSPFPEILGRICPHNVLCECACTLNDGYGAITIGAIEASITDLAFARGLQLPFPGITRNCKVAVIGSGPAGLSCTHFLLRAGIGVDMYERSEEPGGCWLWGSPTSSSTRLSSETASRSCARPVCGCIWGRRWGAMWISDNFSTAMTRCSSASAPPAAGCRIWPMSATATYFAPWNF